MLIEVKHIYKEYYHDKLAVPVLKDVSFSVEAGEYVAVMGPSGSGKSTLMNILGLLDVQTKGDYELDGENTLLLNEKQLAHLRNKKIGFVFQRFHLLPNETALNNVILPLNYSDVPSKQRKSAAVKALEKVGLSDRLNFKPNQLSGGQCQRAAIARAIVTNPQIILADEPTGALDTESGNQVLEIFRELNDEGVTVIMITHEKDVALRADRILYLRDGMLSDKEERNE